MIENHSKEMFADALESMMGEMPLSKVHVKDLCKRCGVHRQLFYYYFRDKYDLVGWIFEQDYYKAITMAQSSPYVIHAKSIMEVVWEHRTFYRRALADGSLGSIEWYLHKFNMKMGIEIAKQTLGTDTLTKAQLFDISHHSHGSIGCLVDWLNGEIDLTPQEFAAYEYNRMSDFLKTAHDTQYT